MLKSNTSSALKKMYADGGGIWSVGYFVSTVDINEAVIRRYISFQTYEDS